MALIPMQYFPRPPYPIYPSINSPFQSNQSIKPNLLIYTLNSSPTPLFYEYRHSLTLLSTPQKKTILLSPIDEVKQRREGDATRRKTEIWKKNSYQHILPTLPRANALAGLLLGCYIRIPVGWVVFSDVVRVEA